MSWSQVLSALRRPYCEDYQGVSESIQEAHEFAREVLKRSSMGMKRQCDANSNTNKLEVADASWLYSLYKKKGTDN